MGPAFRPVSISTLSVAFIVVSTLVVASMGGLMWLELKNAAASIRAQERASGQLEIKQAVRNLAQWARTISDNLAQWDETKQQLVFDEYYSLWRDARIKDAHIVPDTVDGVALYDKLGRVLKPHSGGEPMPARLPAKPPALLYARENDHDHFYSFFPVHADSDGQVLLGYGAIKFDFIGELQAAQQFRYADPASLSAKPVGQAWMTLDELAGKLDFRTKNNKDVDALKQIISQAYGRQMILILLLLVVAAWLAHRILVRPLQRISREINAIDSAAGSPVSEPISGPLRILELANVRSSFNDYQRRLAELHRNLEQSSKDFYDQARHDALTGAFNRRAFEEDLQSLSGSESRHGRNLILFDCDHFKAINDTYGHPVGDAVIASIAEALRQALRVDDRLYRIGGDEFATYLSDTPLATAETIAERCLEHILAHDFQRHGVTEPVTISIGLAHSSGQMLLAELQRQADLAMYTAKRPGNRKIVIYDESVGQASALVANREVSVVFQAIQQPELLAFRYQPIMRLPGLQAEYVEALARIHFEGAVIGPGAIFPIVQARRLDAEFDLAVIAAVRRDLALGLPELAGGVAINLSAPGLLSAKVIAALLELKSLHAGRKIVVEITETDLITQMGPAVEHIERLRAADCVVALDDFGSGYSSLRYLAAMPVDLIKFDISLVHQLLEEESRQRLVVEDVVHMVLNAGYELVAEGVETRELLDKVMAMGFSHAQGFYFDPPVKQKVAAHGA